MRIAYFILRSTSSVIEETIDAVRIQAEWNLLQELLIAWSVCSILFAYVPGLNELNRVRPLAKQTDSFNHQILNAVL